MIQSSPHLVRGNKRMKASGMPPQPQTAEDIEEIIKTLEYQRIIMPKYQDIRLVARVDGITKAIQVYRKKLEMMKEKKENNDKK